MTVTASETVTAPKLACGHTVRVPRSLEVSDPGCRSGRERTAARSGAEDRGSASVWVLALSGVVLLAGVASVLAGLAIIGRHEAGTSADLAALAAASQALSGSAAACAVAEEIAQANGGQLESCELGSDGVVDLTVIVTVRLGSLGLGVARAQARAGRAEIGDGRLPTAPDP